MTKLIKNLAVVLREYTDNQGQKKAQWLNIGSIMQADDGKNFILLDRHINLAALPCKEGSTSVLISAFDPKPKDNQYQAQASAPQQQQAKFYDDDIPF